MVIDFAEDFTVQPTAHAVHQRDHGAALDSIRRLDPGGIVRGRNEVNETDHLVYDLAPAEPFSLMQTALTRATSSGRLLNPQEAIDIQQAVRAMTINGAYQLRIEDEAGSLEPGKWADLVVVDRNPYETPADELNEIKVLDVFLNGELQFSSPSH